MKSKHLSREFLIIGDLSDLSSADRQIAEAHMKQCEQCFATYMKYQKMSNLLRDLPSFERPPSALFQRIHMEEERQKSENAKKTIKVRTVVSSPRLLPLTDRNITRRQFIGRAATGVAVLVVTASFGTLTYLYSREKSATSPHGSSSAVPVFKGWQTAQSSLKSPRDAFFGITSFGSPQGKSQVLIEGGGDLTTGGYLADSELFDFSEGRWTKTADLVGGRTGHTSTLLSHAGNILIAGGYNGLLLNSCKLYDPATKRWLPTAAMNQKRTVHTAVSLENDRVLVVGGWAGSTDPIDAALKSCELYTYNNSSAFWTPIADLFTGRQSPGCVVLPDGRVLVMGGYHDPDHTGLVQTELYDPASQQWSQKANMHVGRWGFGTLWLPSLGKVLVAGGITTGGEPSNAQYTQTTELYDVERDEWTLITNMTYARGFLDGYSNAFHLQDGTVLMVGGDARGTSELFVPNSGNHLTSQWHPPVPISQTGQSIGRGVLLEDTGQVLFVGQDNTFIYYP